MTEHSLHKEIIDWYSEPGDETEARVGNYIIDIQRNNLLIEIQTRNFSAIKTKLNQLILGAPVRLVYPIAETKWIVQMSKSGELMQKRKSAKKGKLTDLFYELVHVPHLMKSSNFSLEVLLIEEEEIRCRDGMGSWRLRGASVKDRKLVNVNNSFVFRDSQDFLRFLPVDNDEIFTNKTLAKYLGVPTGMAQKITYSFTNMGLLSMVGKKKKESLFKISKLY